MIIMKRSRRDAPRASGQSTAECHPVRWRVRGTRTVTDQRQRNVTLETRRRRRAVAVRSSVSSVRRCRALTQGANRVDMAVL